MSDETPEDLLNLTEGQCVVAWDHRECEIVRVTETQYWLRGMGRLRHLEVGVRKVDFAKHGQVIEWNWRTTD